ncbi:hypothetical protein [Zavarzinia sp.]|uniref:hypothetical protein n=1 Tax=Zavarzinia sp. TaxID=2027920 RepID=UPI003BB6A0A8
MSALRNSVRLLLALFALAFPLASPAWAESVAVNQGEGQGLIFSHRGHCYLILPQHVHGRSRAVTIATASPALTGDARIFRSFAPGMDLSIGLVSAGLGNRCAERWQDLPARTDALLDQSDEAVLTFIAASGLAENRAMRIVSRDLDLLTASVTGARDQIFKGTSGAVLRMKGVIIGMAVTSADTSEASFIRIDAIREKLDRLLDSEAATPAPTPEIAADNGTCGPALSSRVAGITCSREPVSADYACSNLLHGRPVRFSPGPVELIVELAGGAPVPVGALRLASRPAEGEAIAPKTIRASFDFAPTLRDRWLPFGQVDVTPFGDGAVVNGSRPRARRLKLSITSTWDDALPTQIDCLSIE